MQLIPDVAKTNTDFKSKKWPMLCIRNNKNVIAEVIKDFIAKFANQKNTDI